MPMIANLMADLRGLSLRSDSTDKQTEKQESLFRNQMSGARDPKKGAEDERELKLAQMQEKGGIAMQQEAQDRMRQDEQLQRSSMMA